MIVNKKIYGRENGKLSKRILDGNKVVSNDHGLPIRYAFKLFRQDIEGRIWPPGGKLPTVVERCQFSTETEISTDLCDVCVQAKLPATISRVHAIPVETYLEKVHSDLCGPLNPTTFSGYRYIAVFIDAATRYAETALLKTKDDVFNEFKTLITREENLSGLKLKRFHSDNGLEYKNDECDPCAMKEITDI